MSEGNAAVERTPIERVMLAAWLGVEPDKLPESMRAHTCADTMARWKKVGEAAAGFATTSDETARLREIISDGADMLDMMITAWVESREVSDEEGKRATIALFSMNAALQSQDIPS